MIKVHAPVTQEETKKIADDINHNPDLLYGHTCTELVNYREE